MIFLGVFFFYPLSAVFHMAGSAPLAGAGQASVWTQVAQPLAFTLWQAVLSTGLTLLIGLPAALIFARYSFPLKSLLRVLVTLPFILPTVVVAVGFNALLGPHGVANSLLMNAFNLQEAPFKVMNTLAAILLAHIFYNTSVVIRVVGSSWTQLDPRLEQAGRVLGASPGRVLSEVTLPLLLPAILAATLLVFLFDFTSFGVILLLGGPRFATMEVAIYTQALEMLNLPLAGLLSAIQLGCTVLMVVIYAASFEQANSDLDAAFAGRGHPKTKRLGRDQSGLWLGRCSIHLSHLTTGCTGVTFPHKFDCGTLFPGLLPRTIHKPPPVLFLCSSHPGCEKQPAICPVNGGDLIVDGFHGGLCIALAV